MEQSSSPSAMEVGRAAFAAMRALDARRPDVVRARRILAPYEELSVIKGATVEQERGAMYLLCASFGDLHRESGQVEQAINWYLRALEYRCSGGPIDFYADLVIEHDLASHYPRALELVRQQSKQWRDTSWLVRCVGDLLLFLVLLRKPWLFAQNRKFNRRRALFEGTLMERLQKSAHHAEV